MVNVRKSYISIRAFGWFTNTKPLMTGLNNEKPNFKKNLWFYNIVASSVSNETGAIETASKMYTHSISLFIVFVADVFFLLDSSCFCVHERLFLHTFLFIVERFYIISVQLAIFAELNSSIFFVCFVFIIIRNRKRSVQCNRRRKKW